jgi:pyruvate formate lyase activating enzyme
VRDWYEIRDYAVTEDGTCPHCGTKLAGHFGKYEGQFGMRRIPITISAKPTF